MNGYDGQFGRYRSECLTYLFVLIDIKIITWLHCRNIQEKHSIAMTFEIRWVSEVQCAVIVMLTLWYLYSRGSVSRSWDMHMIMNHLVRGFTFCACLMLIVESGESEWNQFRHVEKNRSENWTRDFLIFCSKSSNHWATCCILVGVEIVETWPLSHENKESF